MKYEMLFASFVLIILIAVLPVSALQIALQEGKETLYKGEETKFEFAIINAYDNDEMTVETKIDSIVIESDLDVNPSIFYEGGSLLPKEGLIIQFNVKAGKVGDHKLKVKVHYTRTMFSTSRFGATIVVKDVVVRTVLLKVVDSPAIVLQNKTLVLNEVNDVRFRVVGLGDAKATIEPLFDCRPSIFNFNSLKDAEASFEFIPRKEEELKFKLKVYGDNVVEKILTVKPKYIKSNGVSVNLKADKVVLLNDCVKVNLELLNLRKDAIYNVIVRFVGNGSVKPEQQVIGMINPNELKNVEFIFSPKNNSYLKFFIVYFDKFGNAYPQVVERKVVVKNSELLKIVNVSVNGEKISGDVVNLGNGMLNDVVISCGNEEVFVGMINPHSSKHFEIGYECGILKISAKNEVGNKVEYEKAVTHREKFGVTLLAFVAIIAIVLISLAALAYKRSKI